MASPLRTSLRSLRDERGWSQARLAEAAGIARQSYLAIESGRSVPSTEVSLRLARALGVRVEALFRLANEEAAACTLEDAGGPEGGTDRSVPVRIARIGGRELAYRIGVGRTHADEPADGTAVSASPGELRVTPFHDAPPPPDLVAIGCDPSFALVRELLRRERNLHTLWLSAGSEAALRMLAAGRAHVAGIHIHDPATGQYNAPWVDRLVPFPVTRISFARWEQVLLLPAGNPMRVKGLADLARADLRFLNREPGSGSRRLVESELARRGIPPERIPGFLETAADGHRAVADGVASGSASAGVAIRALAEARGLDWIPIAEEPYELVIPNHFLELPAVAALLSLLGRPSLHRQIEALGGYDATAMGRPA